MVLLLVLFLLLLILAVVFAYVPVRFPGASIVCLAAAVFILSILAGVIHL